MKWSQIVEQQKAQILEGIESRADFIKCHVLMSRCCTWIEHVVEMEREENFIGDVAKFLESHDAMNDLWEVSNYPQGEFVKIHLESCNSAHGCVYVNLWRFRIALHSALAASRLGHGVCHELQGNQLKAVPNQHHEHDRNATPALARKLHKDLLENLADVPWPTHHGLNRALCREMKSRIMIHWKTLCRREQDEELTAQDLIEFIRWKNKPLSVMTFRRHAGIADNGKWKLRGFPVERSKVTAIRRGDRGGFEYRWSRNDVLDFYEKQPEATVDQNTIRT